LIWLVWTVLDTPTLDLASIPRFLVMQAMLVGVGQTLILTAVAMAVGIVLGLLSAVAYLSSNRVLRAVAWAYVWFFRGTPVLVQLIFWFNIGIVFKNISIGIPFGPELFSVPTNDLITPISAAILGLGLNEGAYMSEIIRSGVMSVDSGQVEAARALGMSKAKSLRVVILPQALRIIVPPTGNELIGMLKTSALASVISVTELLGASSRIYSANLKVVEVLAAASIWYLLLTSLLSLGQYFLERRLAIGSGLVPSAMPGASLFRGRRRAAVSTERDGDDRIAVARSAV